MTPASRDVTPEAAGVEGSHLEAVVVTYNSAAHIGGCLEALRGDSPRISITVIDNQSTDVTRDIVAGFPDVKLIANRENVGFARAVNQALDSIPQERPVLLLNPDARFDGREALEIAAELARRPDVGAVAPLVRQTEDRMQVVHGGRVPTAWRMLTHQTGLSRLGRRWSVFEGHYSRMRDAEAAAEPFDVDWVSGGCVIISAAGRRSAPRLDETWFMYAEDIEYCWRLRRHGLSVQIDPRRTARHEVGGSRDPDRRASSEWLLNLYEFYRRDLEPRPGGPLVWRAVVAAGLVARGQVYFLRSLDRRRSNNERAHWRRSARDFGTYASDLVKRR